MYINSTIQSSRATICHVQVFSISINIDSFLVCSCYLIYTSTPVCDLLNLTFQSGEMYKMPYVKSLFFMQFE